MMRQRINMWDFESRLRTESKAERVANKARLRRLIDRFNAV